MQEFYEKCDKSCRTEIMNIFDMSRTYYSQSMISLKEKGIWYV